MIRNLFCLAFYLLLLAGAAWAMGVRVHWEEVSQIIDEKYLPEVMQLKFENGLSVLREVVEENDSEIVIKSSAGDVSIPKSDLAQFEKVLSNPRWPELEKYKPWLKHIKKIPIFTHRKEDRFSPSINEITERIVTHFRRFKQQLFAVRPA